MEKITEHINRISSKLQHLLKLYDNLKRKTKVQEEKLAKLEIEKTELQNKIRLLEEQQYLLKASAGKMNVTDIAAFEKALNGYIRQIDQCIHMLQH